MSIFPNGKLPIYADEQLHYIRLAQLRADAQAAHEAESRKLMAQEIAKALQATQSGNGSTPDTNKLNAINEKLDYLVNNKKEIKKKQSAGGKKGAKAAKDRGGIDSQRAEIYASVKSKIDNGMKTDTAFEKVAQDYRKKPSAIKSNYYREKNAKKKETRGKYNRTGKKRGTYKTISHAKN